MPYFASVTSGIQYSSSPWVLQLKAPHCICHTWIPSIHILSSSWLNCKIRSFIGTRLFTYGSIRLLTSVYEHRTILLGSNVPIMVTKSWWTVSSQTSPKWTSKHPLVSDPAALDWTHSNAQSNVACYVSNHIGKTVGIFALCSIQSSRSTHVTLSPAPHDAIPILEFRGDLLGLTYHRTFTCIHLELAFRT